MDSQLLHRDERLGRPSRLSCTGSCPTDLDAASSSPRSTLGSRSSLLTAYSDHRGPTSSDPPRSSNWLSVHRFGRHCEDIIPRPLSPRHRATPVPQLVSGTQRRPPPAGSGRGIGGSAEPMLLTRAASAGHAASHWQKHSGKTSGRPSSARPSLHLSLSLQYAVESPYFHSAMSAGKARSRPLSANAWLQPQPPQQPRLPSSSFSSPPSCPAPSYTSNYIGSSVRSGNGPQLLRPQHSREGSQTTYNDLIRGGVTVLTYRMASALGRRLSPNRRSSLLTPSIEASSHAGRRASAADRTGRSCTALEPTAARSGLTEPALLSLVPAPSPSHHRSLPSSLPPPPPPPSMPLEVRQAASPSQPSPFSLAGPQQLQNEQQQQSGQQRQELKQQKQLPGQQLQHHEIQRQQQEQQRRQLKPGTASGTEPVSSHGRATGIKSRPVPLPGASPEAVFAPGIESLPASVPVPTSGAVPVPTSETEPVPTSETEPVPTSGAARAPVPAPVPVPVRVPGGEARVRGAAPPGTERPAAATWSGSGASSPRTRPAPGTKTGAAPGTKTWTEGGSEVECGPASSPKKCDPGPCTHNNQALDQSEPTQQPASTHLSDLTHQPASTHQSHLMDQSDPTHQPASSRAGAIAELTSKSRGLIVAAASTAVTSTAVKPTSRAPGTAAAAAAALKSYSSSSTSSSSSSGKAASSSLHEEQAGFTSTALASTGPATTTTTAIAATAATATPATTEAHAGAERLRQSIEAACAQVEFLGLEKEAGTYTDAMQQQQQRKRDQHQREQQQRLSQDERQQQASGPHYALEAQPGSRAATRPSISPTEVMRVLSSVSIASRASSMPASSEDERQLAVALGSFVAMPAEGRALALGDGVVFRVHELMMGLERTTPAIQQAATAALGALAWDGPQQRALILEAGVLPTLLHLLGASEPGVRECAAAAVAALAWGGAGAQAAIARAGAAPALLRMMEGGNADSEREQAAGALAVLAWGSVCVQEWVGAAGGITQIIAALAMPTTLHADYPAGPLAQEQQQQQNTAASFLLLQEQATGALWALVGGNVANARRARTAGAVPALVGLVQSSQSAAVRQNAAGCLQYLL